MIDTHCHIDTEIFDEDRAEVIQRAFSGGVESIIAPGIEPKTWDKLLEVVGENEKIYCSMGIHPHHVSQANDEVYEQMLKNITDNDKIIAIGEIGLDYYYDFNPKELQQKVFREQIAIAKKQNLPLIVHNRDSSKDLLNILEQEQDGSLKGVLHCFSGDIEMMEKSIDLGFHISFTGNITFKKSLLTEVVEKAPMSKIMLETDAPWMTPVPLRGRRNEPYLVKKVAEKISEIKSIPLNEVIQMTSENAKKLFKIFIVCILFTGIFAGNAFSQTTTIYDDDYDDYYEDELYDDLYPRTIGFGPVFGTNTIVESYPGGQDISYDGLFAIGGIVNYRVLPYLFLSGSYTFSKNSKLTEKFDVDPNTHQSIELSSFWSPNPNNRVNLYGILGLSYLMNKYSRNIFSQENPKGERTYEYDNKLGINTGIGFNFNIDFDKIGILSIMAEWRLNFALSETSLDFDPRTDPTDPKHNTPTSVSVFYSIPRLALVWYPKF